jgi:Zn-dependent M28 family amino/carboxypeptidase
MDLGGLLLTLPFIIFSCGNTTTTQQENKKESQVTAVSAPAFNADSAYSYVQAQVDFGPRVPNTEAHEKCAEYLAGELSRFGAEVTEQRANLTAFDGTTLRAINIIGSFNTEQTVRILLFAHWDSRPFADNDPNVENHKKPVLGANDGASGVGVLLEIARLIGENPPTVGIDIIFFDAEDYGQPYFYQGKEMPDSWALGSQYWARNPHKPGYRAKYGILLDMVGAKNANFLKEKTSTMYAPHVVEKIWTKARELGYGNLFQNKEGSYITDDHLYVNEIARIPSIDIIDFERSFVPQWHTVNDTMEYIDKGTLKAVGQTILETIYSETAP